MTFKTTRAAAGAGPRDRRVFFRFRINLDAPN